MLNEEGQFVVHLDYKTANKSVSDLHSTDVRQGATVSSPSYNNTIKEPIN